MKTWVIVLIVLGVLLGGCLVGCVGFIGALGYFGVLDPARLVPEHCAVGPPLSCSESAVTSEGVSMFLQNTDSRVMRIKEITVLSDALGDCSWTASGDSYPELESGNPPIVYTLTSSGGAFIPKSAKGLNGTQVNDDNNFNFGAADNSSLAGCRFTPDTSRSKNQYEFTVTYNWEGSESDDAISGTFVNARP